MDELLIVCHMHFNTWQGEIVTGTEICTVHCCCVNRQQLGIFQSVDSGLFASGCLI